jgi:ribosome biogenesis GTPase
MTLEQLGWNARHAAAFAPHAGAGCVPARVTLQLKGFFECVGEAGAKLGECTGRFRHHARTPADQPAIGDWVAVTPQPGDESRVNIHAVLPRLTKFSRKAAGEEDLEQVIAANIDTVFIVTALDADFSPRRIERYLAAATTSGAEPVVLLNKADLAEDEAGASAQIAALAHGAPVHVVSAKTRRGLKALAPWLQPGRTVAFLGSSGVGKSTLINRLCGEQVQATQEVREDDAKGRHTTTVRELIATPGGVLVIDTPGMREFQPWEVAAPAGGAFDDIAALAARCKFRDCSHSVEPGCAVAAALANGALEPGRWQTYLRQTRQLARETRKTDRRAQQAGKAGHKRAMRDLQARLREKSGED